ncbi:MAG: hypothetical protein QXP46_02800 [Archaeoglobaceae archaeon]
MQRYKVRNVDPEVAKISAKLRETGLKLPDDNYHYCNAYLKC